MATTVIDINPEATSAECYQRRVQEEELTDVISKYSFRFRGIAQGHLGNAADAEDAIQDAFLSAWTHVGQFRRQAKMSTWLTTIVINSARMKLRRRLSQVQVALDETDEEQNVSVADTVSDTRPDPEQVFRIREIGEILADAISRLSPTLCRTFQLHDVEGFSIYEIAHILRVPSGTVKTRLARARMRLKQLIKKSHRESAKQSTYGRCGAQRDLNRHARVKVLVNKV